MHSREEDNEDAPTQAANRVLSSGDADEHVTGIFDPDVEAVVVIPTYNEAQNISVITDQLFELNVPKLGIIIVDDGSPDGTGEIADRLAKLHHGRFIVIHRAGKLGLGTAYIRGFKQALATSVDSIVQMDCDLSHPTSEVPAMLEKLRHADEVVGSRYIEGGGADPSWSMGRSLLSKYANVGIKIILGLRVRDATSGFKAHRRATLETLQLEDLKLSGFGFQAELAYRVQQADMTVSEHPYTFMERTAGKSKMSLSIAIEAFWRLTLLRLGRG